jgi:hypothetical protein
MDLVLKDENAAVGMHHVDLVALYPQKLALTSPASDGRSVCIVRSRSKFMELYYYYCY